MNYIALVGRLVENPEIKELDDKKVTEITLAISRSYKNINGEYETDFISCILWNGIASSTTEYCKKGDIIGVKGRLENMAGKMIVIAEKITLLSTGKDNK